MLRSLLLLKTGVDLAYILRNERKIRKVLEAKGQPKSIIDYSIGAWHYIQMSEKDKEKLARKNPQKTRQQVEIEMFTILSSLFQDNEIARLFIKDDKARLDLQAAMKEFRDEAEKEGIEENITDTKLCPYCAETIKARAIVCRYCGRDLPDSLPKKLSRHLESGVENKCPRCGGERSIDGKIYKECGAQFIT